VTIYFFILIVIVITFSSYNETTKGK